MNQPVNDPKPIKEVQLFRFHSPAFNRSKYLTFSTLLELEDEGYSTGLKDLYVNSSIPYWTLVCSLPKWMRWNYLCAFNRDSKRQFKLLKKGKNFLNKLNRLIPSTVEQWLAEQNQWREMLPDAIADWRRSSLINLLEPMRYHRKRRLR